MSNPVSTTQGVIAVPRTVAVASAIVVAILAAAGAWLLWSASGRSAADGEVIRWVDPLLTQATALDRDVVDADRILRLYILQGKKGDADTFDTRRGAIEQSIAELQKIAEPASEAARNDVTNYVGEVSKWLALTGDVFKTAQAAKPDDGRMGVMARLGSQDLIQSIRTSREQLESTVRNARESYLKASGAAESRRATFSTIAFLLLAAAAACAFWLAMMASRVVKPLTPSVDLGMVRAVLDQLTDGIAIFGENGGLIVSNLPAARVVERADSAGGLALFDGDGTAVPPDISPLSRALAGHHVHEREVFAERLDGTLAPVEVRAEPVLEAGHTTAAVIVIRDKEEEQRFEVELQAAAERAATAEANLAELARRLKTSENELEQARGGIGRLEGDLEANQARFVRYIENTGAVGIALFRASDLRLQEINDGGLELLGERRRARDVRGSTLQDIVPGAEASGLADLFRKVAASGEPYSSLEYYCQGLRPGAAYWRFSVVPLTPKDGAPVEELALVGIDITNDVEQRALAAAKPEKVKPTFSIEDVLLAISNDLRTPILSIQGMVDLFRQKYAEAVPDVTALHYLELTQRNADQIAGLIEDLVDLSSLGKTELHVIELPLAAVVEEAWRAGAHSGVELKIAGPLPTVRADRPRLLRALTDIFNVAMRQRRDAGGAVINLQVRDLGQSWEIEVADNGKGFAPEEAEGLFGPLATSLAPSTNGHPSVVGSGIGLAAVRRIAELHGGTAAATGIPGEGATYTMTIAK